VHDPVGLTAFAVDVGQAHLNAVDDGTLEVFEERRRRNVGTVPARRVQHDRRRRRLGVGAERFGQRAHELAQRRFHLRRRGGRRAGDEEEGSRFGRGQAAQVGAGAAHERPSATAARLGVHRDPRHGERFEVATRGAFGDLELLGELGGRDAAARLEDQQLGDEPVSAHVGRISHKPATG
jgi:hypothetical protein